MRVQGGEVVGDTGLWKGWFWGVFCGGAGDRPVHVTLSQQQPLPRPISCPLFQASLGQGWCSTVVK